MVEGAVRLSVAKRRAADDPKVKLPPGPGLSPDEVAAHQTARIRAALIKIIAVQGFEGLKVRELVKVAGVSSRAFYQRFRSKEDCLLSTYELIAARAVRRIIAAQARSGDWRKRALLVFEAFGRELEREPAAAHLALVDIYAAGPKGLERAWRTERIFEGMLADSFARPPAGVSVPPLVIEGMVNGVAHVARERLRADNVREFGELAGELARWMMSLPSKSALGLAELDQNTVWRDTTLSPLSPVDPAAVREGVWPPTGDRSLIFSAVAKLVAAEGRASLTASRIRAEAGVSRGSFDAWFEGVEECYVAVLSHRAEEAFAQAARAQAAARTWAGGVYRAIAALCWQVGEDPFLARVCLADECTVGSEGSLARRHLVDSLVEQLVDSAPRGSRPSQLAVEASVGAIWSVFYRHLIRDWAKKQHIAATLAYLALAPVVGPAKAVTAIEAEQSP
jgi:AcrR family transcriptional regulator